MSEAALCCQQIVRSFFNFVEAKTSLNTMVRHLDLSSILLQEQSGEEFDKSMVKTH
jgi:hypothetical protein